MITGIAVWILFMAGLGCAVYAGYLVGYGRGRAAAETDLAETLRPIVDDVRRMAERPTPRGGVGTAVAAHGTLTGMPGGGGGVGIAMRSDGEGGWTPATGSGGR